MLLDGLGLIRELSLAGLQTLRLKLELIDLGPQLKLQLFDSRQDLWVRLFKCGNIVPFMQAMNDTLGADWPASLLAVETEVIHFFFRVLPAGFPLWTERGRGGMRTGRSLQSVLYGFQRLSWLLLQGVVVLICKILLARTLCEVG